MNESITLLSRCEELPTGTVRADSDTLCGNRPDWLCQ
jgi:hypothetical protein